MITIFTTAKPFKGDVRTRQMNALRSWKALGPDIEIMLFGIGEGYAQAAEELGLVHIPDVEVSEKGTPLVRSMFTLAGARGRYDIQAYVNCDIILMGDFLKAAGRIGLERFMMVGQRWDLDINGEIDFKGDWQKRLKDSLRPENLHPPTGSDYFLFRRGIWKDMPPMVVGRAGYDNWLIYYCLLNGINVIDASEVVTVIHQNHDYSHLAEGKTEAWTGKEAQTNIKLSRGYGYIFSIPNANLRLTSKGLLKNRCRGDWYRFFESQLMLRESSLWCRWGLRCVRAARGFLAPGDGKSLHGPGIKNAKKN